MTAAVPTARCVCAGPLQQGRGLHLFQYNPLLLGPVQPTFGGFHIIAQLYRACRRQWALMDLHRAMHAVWHQRLDRVVWRRAAGAVAGPRHALSLVRAHCSGGLWQRGGWVLQWRTVRQRCQRGQSRAAANHPTS